MIVMYRVLVLLMLFAVHGQLVQLNKTNAILIEQNN